MLETPVSTIATSTGATGTGATGTGATSTGANSIAIEVLARPALFLMIVNNYLQCAVGMIKKLM